MGDLKKTIKIDDPKALVNEIIQPEGGPPLITVRADVLIPMLAYTRKFFRSVQQTQRNAPSSMVDPDEFTMETRTRGFTPEDFNSLQSLNNSLGQELTSLLDSVVTPQMRRVHGRGYTPMQVKAPQPTVKLLTAKEVDDGGEEEK